MRDILVFTPVYRLEPETVQSIFSLEWDGPLTLLLQRDNPIDLEKSEDVRQDGVANHLHQYQRGRELFLRGPYEAMLVIESDIIPPRDTLKRLAALEVDVAYGVYLFRASPVVNVFERYKIPDARNIGESLTVRGLWEEAKQMGVVECSGAGFGCILIRRHVLEEVPFRVEKDGVRGAHCDSYWTRDVYQRGYSMKADTQVICGHKTPEGEILWPA